MAKFYVDQQLPNYHSLANAVAAQFPHVRVAIGPEALNTHYQGTDKQQIEDFIAALARGDVPVPAPSSVATSDARVKQGDVVWVLMPGIGAVEARFMRMLADGRIVVDLDGIEETVEADAVVPPEAPSEALRNDVAPPEPPKADVAPPEPKADVAPPEAPTGETLPPEALTGNVAPS